MPQADPSPEPAAAQPRFIIDAMLGTLAKWLRIAGFDTLYEKDADDDDLFKQAQLEDRILITRDRDLANRKGIRTIYLENVDISSMLRTVVDSFDLNVLHYSFSRCTVCNGLLEKRSRDSVIDRVPPLVADRETDFWVCAQCHHIYWHGTHTENMRQFLENI